MTPPCTACGLPQPLTTAEQVEAAQADGVLVLGARSLWTWDAAGWEVIGMTIRPRTAAEMLAEAGPLLLILRGETP